MRSMVEGVRHPCSDGFGHAIGILHHVDCRNTKDFKSFAAKIFITHCIMRETIPVHFAINFDNQSGISAVEISHIGSDRMLSSKLHSRRTAAQPLPQHHFRQAHRFP